MPELYQCPYNKYTKCNMELSCKGCPEFNAKQPCNHDWKPYKTNALGEWVKCSKCGKIEI